MVFCEDEGETWPRLPNRADRRWEADKTRLFIRMIRKGFFPLFSNCGSTHTFVLLSVCESMCIYVYMLTHVCARACVHTYMCMNVCTCHLRWWAHLHACICCCSICVGADKHKPHLNVTDWASCPQPRVPLLSSDICLHHDLSRLTQSSYILQCNVKPDQLGTEERGREEVRDTLGEWQLANR